MTGIHATFTMLVLTSSILGQETGTRSYQNQLRKLEKPSPLLADHPEFFEPILESNHYEAPCNCYRFRRGPACSRLAFFVQRTGHYRDAKPPQGFRHRGYHGTSMGHRRWPGLEHAGACGCCGFLHPRKKPSCRQTHPRNCSAFYQSHADPSEFGSLQPSWFQRFHPSQVVSVL